MGEYEGEAALTSASELLAHRNTFIAFSAFSMWQSHNSLVQRGYPVSSPCIATWVFKRTKPCSLSLGKKRQ